MPNEKDAVDPIKHEIDSNIWFHSIELPGGYITPGKKSLEIMKKDYANTFNKLSLDGRTVLDVGAWNGAFSVEALRRGAKKVTALDHFVWNSEYFQGRKAFDFVVHQTGSAISAVDIDLDQPRLDLSHLGQFDVVLLLGVFYHLVDPIAALREVSSIAREVMVLETYIEAALGEEAPAMRFYPGAELANDPTNWWGPNVTCIVELMRMNGFARIDVSAGSHDNRKVFHAYRS